MKPYSQSWQDEYHLKDSEGVVGGLVTFLNPIIFEQSEGPSRMGLLSFGLQTRGNIE